MSRKSEFLRKRERMEITLPTLPGYYGNSKKIKGRSPKTLVAIHSILELLICFLEQRGVLATLLIREHGDASVFRTIG